MTPYGINIIVKPYHDISQQLIVTDTVKGDLYEVVKVGEGYMTEMGKLIPLEVRPGDIVAIQGSIKTIPFNGERYMVARGLDVLCYYRPNDENIGIPDKI